MSLIGELVRLKRLRRSLGWMLYADMGLTGILYFLKGIYIFPLALAIMFGASYVYVLGMLSGLEKARKSLGITGGTIDDKGVHPYE